ncbi:MAG: glycosyltransferase family 4 protein [Nitrososphaerota archaeon]|nr:glycosyltransferase family 4 protein [Nitrososphaerota archaeon]
MTNKVWFLCNSEAGCSVEVKRGNFFSHHKRDSSIKQERLKCLATFLIVHPYLDIYGGGERVCHGVIKALVNQGQKVELLTFDFDADRYRNIVGEDFPSQVVVHSLGQRTKEKPPFTIYKRHRNFVKLLKKYRYLEYDYLFSTQSSSPFEPVFLNKAKKNIAYVHFPEIHYDYARGTFKRKLYLWLFRHWVEQGIGKLDLVFCNSLYTKEAMSKFWKIRGDQEPFVVYPPVNLDKFWCDKPLFERKKRVVYVARFIPVKRHEILKRLARDLPQYEFVSVGGLIEAERPWFEQFSINLPPNYSLKPNLPGPQLIDILQDSRIYVHLMEGEHFGIAPVEGLASGCVTIVHNSGGMKEFISREYRWDDYEDLKAKIVSSIEQADGGNLWEDKREKLWKAVSALTPQTFQDNICGQLELCLYSSSVGK